MRICVFVLFLEVAEDKGRVVEHDMYSEFSELLSAICSKVIPNSKSSLGMCAGVELMFYSHAKS